jgi:prolyl oligopeptidase PreP (S9A serine peptidase family)
LQIHDRKTGKFIEKLPIPIGSVGSIHTRGKRTEVFFAFESILQPPTLYRFDYADKHELGQVKFEMLHQSKIEGFNPENFETKQVFYSSKGKFYSNDNI